MGLCEGLYNPLAMKHVNPHRPTPEGQPAVARADPHAKPHHVDPIVEAAVLNKRRPQRHSGLRVARVNVESLAQHFNGTVMQSQVA